MLEEIIYKLGQSILALLILIIQTNNNLKIIQDILHVNINYEEASNETANIDNNFAKITGLKSLNSNQIKVINTYFMVKEIITAEAKELMENDKGEIYIFKPKSDHPDEQKESNTARQRFAEQPNEQPDTIGIPDLESEESAEQKKMNQNKV